jgi:hypothetical protein
MRRDGTAKHHKNTKHERTTSPLVHLNEEFIAAVEVLHFCSRRVVVNSLDRQVSNALKYDFISGVDEVLGLNFTRDSANEA